MIKIFVFNLLIMLFFGKNHKIRKCKIGLDIYKFLNELNTKM